MELLIVFARILSASFANVFQKKLTHQDLHPFFIVMVSYLVLSLICIPLLWTINFDELSSSFWLNIFFAALIDMVGTLFLVMSLSKTDLSIFGPLNAYKVVISMILAMIFLGEIPNSQGFLGVAVILVGSFFLFPSSEKRNGNRLLQLFTIKGVRYRFLSILLFSIGTLPLKNAVIIASPLATAVFWCLIGFPLAILAYVLFIRGSFAQNTTVAKQYVPQFFCLGVLMFLMQYTTMVVLSKFFIAYTLALFQLSMVLHVFLGYRIFNEQHVLRRMASCLVMVAGSLLVLNA
ncbi:MAG: multidrug transporter [Gammaproteobacteria bacterium]|nr:EamA family transporter [Pseudomonadota bacterium]PCH63428.1 MAG: multidrug transporter [Gammaproteobacteria bacterium]